jgi:hypothetical protein
MTLSNLQKVLLAQLWASRDSSGDGYSSAMMNRKTQAFTDTFARAGLLTVDATAHELSLSSNFETMCVEQGIVTADDPPEFTELGNSLLSQKISESPSRLHAVFFNNRAK